MSDAGLQASEEKMRAAGVAPAAIAAFAHYYRRLEAGETGLLPESEIEPVDGVPDLEALPPPPAETADALLDRTVLIRLNGGLGTSMGMSRAKSLIEAHGGRTFLDLIVAQVLSARARHSARLPLLLMDSFSTRDDTLAALAAHHGLERDGLPLDFLQNREPKLRADDLTPVQWPADPALEWCPPGHGDLYTALAASGTLAALRERGYRYAFVANSDNLGAALDTRLLAWFADSGAPFAMEVADRTEADRKGGHLARRRGGGLVLREAAQAPDADQDAFQDVARHRYFNTNNLWLDLDALAGALAAGGDVLALPMIVNRKTADPRDPDSPAVIQIETAMGAAISVFPGAEAIRVPRTRLIPVKTTNDLLALRSDRYAVAQDGTVGPAPGCPSAPPVIDLDPAFFKLLDDFEARFPGGPPSLAACERLTVRGDVEFGAHVAVRGATEVIHTGPGRLRISGGTVL